MNWSLLARNLGFLGLLIGISMLFCLPWSFPACGEAVEFERDGLQGITLATVCSLVLAGGLIYLGRGDQSKVLRKEALAIVGLGWIFAGLLGSLPYLFSGTMRSPGQPMSVADAIFESISGFTTTGASVLSDLEDSALIPRSILFWRCFTHWLGGMGIIVLFVAILGQLGAAGKALMRREVPGPLTETVRPRVRETAMVMWAIYVGLSGILANLFLLEGMTIFDALCHTFGTMATGGFSTRNGSIGSFGSPLIEATTILFMVIAGTNFSLFYLVMKPRETPVGQWRFFRRLRPLGKDPEFRCYLLLLSLASLGLALIIWSNGLYPSFPTALRHGIFQSVTIMTTTGFGTENFAVWPEFAKSILLLLMFIGGCAGSTGGGIKVIRYILIMKLIRLEVEQAYKPNLVRTIRVADSNVDNSLLHDVVTYFTLMLFLFVSFWLILVAVEPDTAWQQASGSTSEKLVDCASAVAATLNNIGPGLGIVGPHANYAQFSALGKLILTLPMLLGRLELFAILVLFKRSFWLNR